MSIGFHYFETLKQSLSLQWLTKDEAPEFLGKLISIGSLAALCTYGGLWVVLELIELDFKWVYLLAGGSALAIVIFIAMSFPEFESRTPRINLWCFESVTGSIMP